MATLPDATGSNDEYIGGAYDYFDFRESDNCFVYTGEVDILAYGGLGDDELNGTDSATGLMATPRAATTV